ncbi:MAG: glutathione S-transferase family protein [Sphingomonadaceae bacterium]
MRPILHHYPTSPWAEVVRLALGLKGLAWGSVDIPVTAPKPDLAALTGGYVRTPVLQLGADIFCDTLAILDALEALAPEPTLYPEPLGRSGHRDLAREAGGATFFAAVGQALGDLPDEGMEEFWADRERRFGLQPDRFRAMVPGLRQAFAAHLSRLEGMLADGRPFLGGEAPGHGDLAQYMLVWFAARGGPIAEVARGLAPWAARVAAIGHGMPEPMSAEAALAQARKATPSVCGGGRLVAVRQEGSNDPPSLGQLAQVTDEGFTITRSDARAGDVAVHFPHDGQILTDA